MLSFGGDVSKLFDNNSKKFHYNIGVIFSNIKYALPRKRSIIFSALSNLVQKLEPTGILASCARSGLPKASSIFAQAINAGGLRPYTLQKPTTFQDSHVCLTEKSKGLANLL
ncbi:hypothetical protein TNCT_222171 [Trichonephila clavata]|uniref:Uncharacterized protein n=1 Tax=Trichonephila clavata TaxID=2740835 RepID=A0A8X6H1N4_TRICU|nr:hypothetical protein TNCT_222171 [Trichonephila clavata]